MTSANGGLPAHRYTPQVTPRWPRGSEPASPSAHTRNQRTSSPTNAPPRPQHVHQPREIRTAPPALRHSDTTMAEPAAPRKTRPRSPTLDAAHEVIRALGLRGGEEYPPQEDAGTNSDVEEIPEPSTGRTPAEPAPPAGSVPTLCPAWKRRHCTSEGWCPKQHPQYSLEDGALPEVGRAPHAPPYATGWCKARSWMRPHAAA